MTCFSTRLKAALAVATVATLACGSSYTALADDVVGSSSATPYLVATAPGVEIEAILTVGDSVNKKPDGTPYRMVGIPDGLGIVKDDNEEDTFTLLMNHELQNNRGIARAHGGTGAFVSAWTISQENLKVVEGHDLMQTVMLWDSASKSYKQGSNVAFSRFCSGDMPAPAAFYNEDNNTGYRGRIYMNGEETGAEGRALAHLLDGTTYELPRLGKFSWENSIANPATGAKTVVAGNDDGTGGQVYIYVGDKTNSGSPVDRAGLTNGNLFGVKVDGVAAEDPASGIAKSRFSLYGLGNVEGLSGAQLEANSTGNVTSFQRPEDGAWDPKNPNDYYFVTTASFTGNSRLWRLRFDNRKNPAAGGQIEMLLDGSEGQKMMDNITITKRGEILIQEDPGNQAHIAKIWYYNIASDTLTQIAQHDPSRFAPGAANFLTQDEESSGIIDASEVLGRGWFLLDVQAHYSTDGELVEGGQLLALRIPSKLR